MQLKMTSLKSIINFAAIMLFSVFTGNLQAQEVVVTDSTAIQDVQPEKDTIKASERFKVDGVAAVVGDYVVLESDIDKMYIEMKSQGASVKDVTPCQLAGRLMENKLHAHHAIQDSLIVNDAEVNATVDQQLAYMAQ